jgi:hypothetical protein
MLRVYKKNSLEIGDYTTTNNLMNFEDDLQSNELLDMNNSYYQLNCTITPGTNSNIADSIKLYSMGTNDGELFVPYSPSALVMNSKLQSSNYKVGQSGLMESNRKINFLRETLNKLEVDEETRQSRDYFTGTASIDLSQGQAGALFPFTTLLKDGNVKSTYNSSNLILPLKEVLPSFGDKVLPSWVGSLKHTLTLENRKNIIGEVNPLSLLPTTHYSNDTLAFDDKIAATADVRLITISGLESLAAFRSYTSSNLKVGNKVGLTYTQGGANVRNRLCAITAITFTDNPFVVTIQFNAGDTGFADTEVISLGVIHLNILALDNVTGAAKLDLTTDNVNNLTNLQDSPLYVGMPMKIYYLNATGPAYQSQYKKITVLGAGAGVKRNITVDPAGNIPISSHVFATFEGCYDNTVKPTYVIDKAELVSWHLQDVKEQSKAPILYNKYDLLPENRPATSKWQKTYQLPTGGVVKNVMLLNEISSDLNLELNDYNLNDYRVSFQNTPVTDQNVVMNTPMHYDRIYKGLGEINNLLTKVDLIVENNNTSAPSPLLDIELNAKDGEILSDDSIANLFVKSVAVLQPPK